MGSEFEVGNRLALLCCAIDGGVEWDVVIKRPVVRSRQTSKRPVQTAANSSLLENYDYGKTEERRLLEPEGG